MNFIHNKDYEQVAATLETQSADLIIADPPYGTTPLNWDKKFSVPQMWEIFKRIIKPKGVILIFGQEPFSSMIRSSNLQDYKYDWYWQKERLTNVFQVKRRPGKVIETISVFYSEQPTYNPQKSEFTGKKVTNKIGENARWSETMAGKSPKTKPFEYNDNGTRHPLQILKIARDNQRKAIHPTQKPLALIEYFIKTYTNEGDTIFDPFAGSMTSVVAATSLNRNCIACENDDKHYIDGVERIYSQK